MRQPAVIPERDGAEREIERLLLQLRGLVLVRAILEQRGASDAELEAHQCEIDRVRACLASVVARGFVKAPVAA